MKKRLTMTLFIMITACSTNKGINTTSKLFYCKEPRPLLCTMDYTPVCGQANGSLIKTYGNACVACSDYQVTAFTQHACLPNASGVPSIQPKTK